MTTKQKDPDNLDPNMKVITVCCDDKSCDVPSVGTKATNMDYSKLDCSKEIE